MFALKPLSHESVASALAKAEPLPAAERNRPRTESICQDILEIEPDNQAALGDDGAGAKSDQISDDPH